MLFGLRLWASVCLALYVAFWLELDNAFWAGTTAAIVCQPHLGASLRKGWFRMVGTLIGAVAIVLLTACFPQDRALFLISLALWGAASAFASTLLHNFAAYSAALAGYTAAIIASDQLGATGGLDGDAFMLAITRASEIGIGIVSAGIVLAGTDLGGARRRLATLFADLTGGITAGFIGTFGSAGSGFTDPQTARREFARRVIALDPVIDETLGESSQIRYHSPVLQKAVDGLFAVLAAWRAVANHLARLSGDEAQREAAVILRTLSPELRTMSEGVELARWSASPTDLYRICETAAQRLVVFPAATPSLRLLADKTAQALGGMSYALNGLALLVADPARPVGRGGHRLRVADWLPPLVNAGRAFVTIGTMALFWIVTAWPNGALAMTFAAIGVILYAPRADQAYAGVMAFTVGIAFTAVLAAIIGFAVLPRLDSFTGFALAIGLVLVPGGAAATQPWQTATFAAMAAYFVPLLSPANQMAYDTVQFYNTALAIIAGLVAAAWSFRLMPPLSPAYRARRLLVLSLRDLRRQAKAPVLRSADGWESRMYGRLSVLPNDAEPLQRAQLLAALLVGTEIIQLRRIAGSLDLRPSLDDALAALARGNVAGAIDRLNRVDKVLAGLDVAAALQGRGSILVIVEALTEHAAYFATGAQG